MLRKLVALSIFMTLTALGAALYGGAASTQTTEIEGDAITLTGRARRAKARGEYQLNITSTGEYDGAATLDDALGRYTVLVAEPLMSRSYLVDDIGLRTWYKFRVSETISQKPYYVCPDCATGGAPAPPADMLPLNSNEILVYAGGGNMVIEDVSVREDIADAHTYLLAQKYLLFLNYDAGQQAGGVDLGAAGIFILRGTDTLENVHLDSTGAVVGGPVADGVAARYANSLTQMRNAINPPPPPTSCDPDGSREMACYDNGGMWNASTCYCRIYDICSTRPWKCDGGGPYTY